MKARQIFLEKIIEGVRKNTYILHAKGGAHLFDKRCSSNKKIKKIYRKQIWPYIEKVGAQGKKRPCIGSITARDPYPKINLGMEGPKKVHLSGAQFVKRTFYIHRLVAIAFLYPEIISKRFINHINGKTVDYRVCNLEWVTISENNSVPRPRGKTVYDKKYDIFKVKKFL